MKTSRRVIIFSKGSLPPCKWIIFLQERITDAIIKAVGNPYHARCFKCVGCEKNLDGVPFSMDVECSIYCVQCFQLRFSPRCCVCHDLIMPTFEQKVCNLHCVIYPIGGRETKNMPQYLLRYLWNGKLGWENSDFALSGDGDGDQPWTAYFCIYLDSSIIPSQVPWTLKFTGWVYLI